MKTWLNSLLVITLFCFCSYAVIAAEVAEPSKKSPPKSLNKSRDSKKSPKKTHFTLVNTVSKKKISLFTIGQGKYLKTTKGVTLAKIKTKGVKTKIYSATNKLLYTVKRYDEKAKIKKGNETEFLKIKFYDTEKIKVKNTNGDCVLKIKFSSETKAKVYSNEDDRAGTIRLEKGKIHIYKKDEKRASIILDSSEFTFMAASAFLYETSDIQLKLALLIALNRK